MIRGLLLALGLLALAAASDPTWEEYKSKYHKKYASEVEERARRGIFEEKLKWAAGLNRRQTNGVETFGASKCADWTRDEVHIPARFQRRLCDGKAHFPCGRITDKPYWIYKFAGRPRSN